MVGRDRVEYFEDSGSPTTTILETKILVNSVILDCHKGARFMSMDIKVFFTEVLHEITRIYENPSQKYSR